MISKIYINTSDASLIQSVQTTVISRFGYKWSMGPVEEMKTVKTISPSKWAWMVLQDSNILTTNKDPDTSNKSIMVATSLSDVVAVLEPSSLPVYSQSSLLAAFIGNTFDLTDNGFTASFTSSTTYNRKGNITGQWSFGDGSSSSYVSTITHSYGALQIYTASLALTESMYNLKSSVSASVDSYLNRIVLI